MDDLQKQKIQLFIEETKIELNNFIQSFPAGFRKLLFGLVILAIPIFFTARFVSAKIYQNQHRFDVVAAHPAATNPLQIEIVKVRSIQQVGNDYAAYALIRNPNDDLVAPFIEYTFSFYDSEGSFIRSSSSRTFILAGEEKYVVLPNIELSRAPDVDQGVRIEIPDPEWKKRLMAPETSIVLDKPTGSDISGSSAGIRGFRIQGKFTIQGIHKVRVVKLYGLAFDANSEVIAVSQTRYDNMDFGRAWDYAVDWPVQIGSRVASVAVYSETDVLDYDNFY